MGQRIGQRQPISTRHAITPHAATPAAVAAAATGVTQAHDTTSRLESIDVLQLKHLAKAVMSKDTDDLAALAETNPMLVREWCAAFQRQHAAAEKQARYWASASAALATIQGMANPARSRSQQDPSTPRRAARHS
ncbi:MAG: hypothetical protein K0U34_06100 [Alphaproteobacteria bacterium]|nr:hypothetical protein [Alphaproteobacteria bacterium]